MASFLVRFSASESKRLMAFFVVKIALGLFLGMFWAGVVEFVLRKIAESGVSAETAQQIHEMIGAGKLRLVIISLVVGAIVFGIR